MLRLSIKGIEVATRSVYIRDTPKNVAKFTENICARVSLLIKLQAEPYNFMIKNEALLQVFSCEFCVTFKSTIFTEHIWANVYRNIKIMKWCYLEKNLPKISQS